MMPIAKVKASSNLDAMKSEGNDSVDAIIRQAIGKEPFLSFSRTGDSPVQLIQLLHALDLQEPLGWPLLSPLKVQMQKCDKCSREFCSPINYRRHTRAHHRSKKLDKDSMKNRDLLGAFWDNLTVEDAKEVVSFKNVILDEVPGSSIIKALTTIIRKPGFSALPHMYLKAGSALLDIIEARFSRFLISSQELFSILDDASEKTFLSGSALTMQRYIFDGDAGKIGLESKNLVACTSFLLEQKLIKAWLADKDAEAMRLQKMLVEEEEAAQRRHAELLERKRQKKLRQKEQRARGQEHNENPNVKDTVYEMPEAVPPAETSSSYETCDLHTPMPDMQYHITCYDHSNSDASADSEFHAGVRYDHCNLVPDLDVERNTAQGTGRKHLVGCRWQLQPKFQRATSNFFHAGENSHPSKVGGMQFHGMYRDLRTTSTGKKVWSRKHKPESDGESSIARVEKEDPNEPDPIKNHEVVIGSITVSLGNCSHESNNVSVSCHDCLIEHQRPKNNSEDKPNTLDSVKVFTNRSTVKLWRPVSRNGVKGPMAIQTNNRESSSEDAKEGHGESLNSENCPRLCTMNGCDDPIEKCSINPDGTGNSGFSNHAVKAFLAQRWKEVFAADHVQLVLSPESEQECLEVQNGGKEAESHL